MSDIFINKAAFKPFCRWRVSVSRAGEDVGMFYAKVYLAKDDPLLETSTSANRLTALVAIPVDGVGGWNDRGHPPRTGDKLEIASGPSGVGMKFAVKSVSPLVTHVYQLEACQCSSH